ncbi:MAG: hypothetical protein GY696_01205 [Gammaproteobacteria bacterium]|nr:hypothetical protein [Gammaproteobacteria bacterium]
MLPDQEGNNCHLPLLGLHSEREETVAGHLARMENEQAAKGVHESPSLDWDIVPAVWQFQNLSSPGLAVISVIQVFMGQAKPARLYLHQNILQDFYLLLAELALAA